MTGTRSTQEILDAYAIGENTFRNILGALPVGPSLNEIHRRIDHRVDPESAGLRTAHIPERLASTWRSVVLENSANS
jgi:hypothetical protein